jgi:hypothetical protein
MGGYIKNAEICDFATRWVDCRRRGRWLQNGRGDDSREQQSHQSGDIESDRTSYSPGERSETDLRSSADLSACADLRTRADHGTATDHRTATDVGTSADFRAAVVVLPDQR